MKKRILIISTLLSMAGCEFHAKMWDAISERLDSTPPEISSVTPNDGTDTLTGTTSPTQTVAIVFNEDIDPNSVDDTSLSISPEITDGYSLSVSGKRVLITPSTGLTRGTTYTVTFQAPLADTKGNALTTPLQATFFINSDFTLDLDQTIPAGPGTSTAPPFHYLKFVFNEPVDLTASPSISVAGPNSVNPTESSRSWSANAAGRPNTVLTIILSDYVNYAPSDSDKTCTITFNNFISADGGSSLAQSSISYTMYKGWENTGCTATDITSSSPHYAFIGSAATKSAYLVYLTQSNTIKVLKLYNNIWSSFGSEITTVNTDNLRGPSAFVRSSGGVDSVVIAYSYTSNGNIHIATVTAASTTDVDTGIVNGINYSLSCSSSSKVYLLYYLEGTPDTAYVQTANLGSYSSANWTELTSFTDFASYNLNNQGSLPLLSIGNYASTGILSYRYGSSASSYPFYTTDICSQIRTSIYTNTSSVEQIFMGITLSTYQTFDIYKLVSGSWVQDSGSVPKNADTNSDLLACSLGNYAAVIFGVNETAQLYKRNDSTTIWSAYQNLTGQDIRQISESGDIVTDIRLIYSPNSDGILAAYQTGNTVKVMHHYKW